MNMEFVHYDDTKKQYTEISITLLEKANESTKELVRYIQEKGKFKR